MILSLRRKRKMPGPLPSFLYRRDSLASTSLRLGQQQTSETAMTVPSPQRRRHPPKRGRVLLLTTVLLLFCWITAMVGTVRRLQSKWQNHHGLVHVVQTRFMQFQPHLVHLGKARLDLFKALTLPSIREQTSREFLWIIRTDPDLDATLRQELVKSLAPLPNVLLVGSNENPEGFRGAISDITSDSVWLGSLDLVHSYHEAAQYRRVLETRLDADDALATNYCETLQAEASSHLTDDSWIVWCTDVHVEWQFISPWNATDQTGALLGVKTQQCITAGLTWGLGAHMDRSEIGVRNNHAKLHTLVSACNDTVQTKCLARLSSSNELPMAMRARTPTSAGMDRILQPDTPGISAFKKSKWRTSQQELWRVLPPLFGIKADGLPNAKLLIRKNMYNIVKDGLDGQCTKGHSCKENSRLILKKLLDEARENGLVE